MKGRNIFLIVMTVCLAVFILFIGDNWNKDKVPLMISFGVGFWILTMKRYWSVRKRKSDRIG